MLAYSPHNENSALITHDTNDTTVIWRPQPSSGHWTRFPWTRRRIPSQALNAHMHMKDQRPVRQTGRGCTRSHKHQVFGVRQSNRCMGVLQGKCRCTTGSQGRLLLDHFPWPPSRSSRSKAPFLVGRGAMHPRCKPITSSISRHLRSHSDHTNTCVE